jgi:hypothetical protein
MPPQELDTDAEGPNRRKRLNALQWCLEDLPTQAKLKVEVALNAQGFMDCLSISARSGTPA